MSNPEAPSVLIVGAGAMGTMAGYHLGLAGAEVTFLVRPTRVEQLSRPQVLYSYDEANLQYFSATGSSRMSRRSATGRTTTPSSPSTALPRALLREPPC